ncbi:MAG: HEAT repeat domain-containing protein [Ignavibacteria bacterium]|jgi:HEAT repeat protein|nr:HEAT repeat domain-containing protein [Ignavibacteria bacterium]MDH7526805.1 HEAT repeat domain-containing protein [Ignavibacteria bacterium]
MNRLKLFLVIFIVSWGFLYSQIKVLKPGINSNTSFAIFIDNQTFEKAYDAVIRYKNSIEQDNLATYVLINNWQSPEEIKNEILKLYNSKPKLEGAVFIGEIPIPMIREAQHLTSAFKLDEQRFSWDRSSVPSDRFYDDFDLKFEFIKKDSVHKLYFYYRLLPESPQRIEKEIYTARIKPSPDSLKYEKIKNYLLKVSSLKANREKLNNVLVFTGHGYNSESLTSWTDETQILIEHFPEAFKVGGRYKKYFYEMDKNIKKVILDELENPELDIAIFHAHGVSDAQLLSSYPKASNVNENIESIKFYLRSKLRSAKESNRSIEETKEYFKISFGVPDDWFNGAFDDEVIRKDSILNYDLDVHIDDIRKLSPQPKFVIFDECFNGSFHLDEYIAGEYVFGNGNIVAALANSVNVLQDLFVNELIGLLNFGARIGQWNRFNNYLESHIIGDPTFRFSSDTKMKIDELINSNDIKMLTKLLNSSNPVLRTLAVRKLFEIKQEGFSSQLVDIYLNDISPNVRLMVLKCLAQLRNKNFEEVLVKSINDPNELIRRFCVQWMGFIGKEEFLPLIVRASFDDESDRVRYNAKSVMELINSSEKIEIISREVEKILNEKKKYGFTKDDFFVRIPDKRRQNEIFEVVENDTINLRKRIFEVRTFRKYIYEDAVDKLIEIAKNEKKPKELRKAVIEALGWYYFSPKRFDIIRVCNELKNKSEDLLIREEAIRTINRLTQGPNNPFTS